MGRRPENRIVSDGMTKTGVAVAFIALAVTLVALHRQSTVRTAEAKPVLIPQFESRVQASAVTEPAQAVGAAASTPGPTATYEVTFPDGEQFPVTLRPMPWIQAEELPHVADSYDALVKAANGGDGVAALTLGRNLDECFHYAYPSEAALVQAIDELKSTHSYRAPGGYPVHVSTNEQGVVDVQGISQRLTTITERCRGLTPEQKQEWGKWLAKAGDEMVFLGAFYYAQSASKKGADRLAAWEKVWALGSPLGLAFMAEAYAKGSGGLEPDPVKAYAYELLHLELLQVVYSDREGVVSPYFWSRLESSPLEQRAAALTHAQAARALQMAKKTLRENENCCIGLWTAEKPMRPIARGSP